MKATILTTFVLVAAVLQNAAGNKSRNNRRMLKRRCDNLCRSYARTIEIRMLDGRTLTKPELSTILEQTIKRISYSAETYIGVFREHMKDIEKYISEGYEMKNMCQRVKICKALLKNGGKKIKEEKKSPMSKEKSCKICKSVVVVVKASLSVVNNTLENTGSVVKLACNMFMTRSQELKKCLSIVDRVGQFNSKIFQQVEAVDICTIFGFCGNSSLGFGSSCQEHLKGLSPWATALSVMREASTLLMSDGKSTGDILKNIKQEELFSTIGKCMSDMKTVAESGSKRARRSVDTIPCPLCEMIEKNLSLTIQEKASDYDGQLYQVCRSLTRHSRLACRPVAALAKSFQDIASAILPANTCRRIACPVITTSNRTCEMCKTVQKVAKQRLTAFAKVVDYFIDQVDQICSLVGSKAIEKECQKAGKIAHNVSTKVIAMLKAENFCKDMFLC